MVLWLFESVCIVGFSYNHSVRLPSEEALTAWLACILGAGQSTCVTDQLWASQDSAGLQREGALTLRRLRPGGFSVNKRSKRGGACDPSLVDSPARNTPSGRARLTKCELVSGPLDAEIHQHKPVPSCACSPCYEAAV